MSEKKNGCWKGRKKFKQIVITFKIQLNLLRQKYY